MANTYLQTIFAFKYRIALFTNEWREIGIWCNWKFNQINRVQNLGCILRNGLKMIHAYSI
jgi:hypothetical protein